MYLKGTKKKKKTSVHAQISEPYFKLGQFSFNINFWEWEQSRELKVDYEIYGY